MLPICLDDSADTRFTPHFNGSPMLTYRDVIYHSFIRLMTYDDCGSSVHTHIFDLGGYAGTL